MHSASPKTFDPATLLRTILTAAETLFSDVRWPQRLFEMEAEGAHDVYSFIDDYSQNVLMHQIDMAIRQLKPVERMRFFGFNARRRSYLCPECWSKANRENEDNFPTLAQLESRSKSETRLRCVVCAQTSEIERKSCINLECKGNVVFQNVCLTCVWEQDVPYHFPSGLQDKTHGFNKRYDLRFSQLGREVLDDARFGDDAKAIEHARLAMMAPYLNGWTEVTVSSQRPGFLNAQPVGTWRRSAEGLIWVESENPKSDNSEQMDDLVKR
jgi:hypothetical protein